MHHRLLVFDFDGVLADSFHDSFLTALNSYLQMQPALHLPLDQLIAPPQAVIRFENEHPDVKKRFRALMPFGNRAEDYFVILHLMDRHPEIVLQSESEFLEYKVALGDTGLDRYQKIFYRQRMQRQQSDPAAWAALLPPFKGIVKSVRDLSRRFTLAIATSKDRLSVSLLLKQYKLASLFNEDYILDKDFGQNKRGHLVRLQEITDTASHDMHFIDDKLLHLRSVQDLGVHLYLAAWGYNTAREREQAANDGFQVLELDRLRYIGAKR